MIRFAGVELLMPSDKLETFVSRFIPPRREAIFGDFTRADGWNRQRWNWPEPPPLSLNSLYWPTGATRWAQGLFLADDAAKQQIVEAVTDSGRVVSYQSAMLELSEGNYSGETFLDANRGGWKRDQNGRVLLGTKMYLLPPRPVTVVTGYGSETVWLLPLVDDRYFWRYRATDTTFDDESDPGEKETWTDTLDELAGFLDISDEFKRPSQIDPEWGCANRTGVRTPNTPPAPLLDLAAANTGNRIVRSFNGDVSVQTPTEAANLIGSASDKWARVAGSGSYFPDRTVCVPEETLIRFQGVGGTGDGDQTTVQFSDLMPGGPDHDTDGPPIPVALPIAGDTAVFQTSEWRLKTSANGDQEMEDFAKTFARAFYSWRGKEYDIAFAGVKEWPISGFDDAVEFMLSRDAILTRVWTIPPGSELRMWLDESRDTAFVKPDQDVQQGILSSPDNLFSVWKGKAFGVDDADTGEKIEGDYATRDFKTTDYCVAVRVGSKWYISCFDA